VRIPGSGRLALALAAALAAVAARPAAAALPAAEGERVSAQRLRFEQKCFYEIDQWKGKGEEKFLERVEKQIPIYAAAKASEKELDELQELLGECYHLRVKHYAAANDTAKQSEFYGKILKIESSYGKLAGLKAEAQDFVLRENLGKAQAAFKAGNFEVARAMYKDLVGIPKVQDEAVHALVSIEMQEGGYQGAVQSGDLEVVERVFGEILGKIEQSLGPLYASQKTKNSDISEMEKKREEIKNTTQWLSIRPFDIARAVEGVAGVPTAADMESATFLFEPSAKDSGQRFPLEGKSAGAPKDPKDKAKFKEKFLFFRGTYNVSVFVGGRPVAASCQFTVGDAQMTYEFPNRIPAGMIYVDKWKDGGGFFIDATEVTVAQVTAAVSAIADPENPERKTLESVIKETKGQPDDPAWFEEDGALAFEKATGKTIPTKDEWLQAAFGPYTQSQRRYPWGSEEPTEDRAYVATTANEPRPVGGRDKGRSPFQVEDMVGNLSEWVRIEGRLWLMGGNLVTLKDTLAKPGQGNPMRDPQPGKVAYEDMADGLSQADKTRLNDYKVDSSEAYVTGLRMVVKVNK
jgi:tetratricopeptide (TPR) repeat protein